MNEPPTSERQICNLEASLARLGDDEQLLCELIDFYLEDYQMLLQRIEAAVDSGDPTSVSRDAHSLKGLAATFDGVEVVEAANAITQAVRAGFSRPPKKEIAILGVAAEELASYLRKARDNEAFD